ncbi:MAG: hypothetical protein HDR86_09815 [Bacteroides sp.]|nr:hypothetical protein [Bacteroides sp.]
MKQSYILRTLMVLMLPLTAASVASAANRLFIDPVNIEPGETMELAFQLENDDVFYGFQADIALPEGLSFVKGSDDRAEIRLSDRCGSDFSVVSNLLNERSLRMGTFSSTHSSIAGNQGELMSVAVMAHSDFAGGELSVSKILFVEEGDTDIEFPDFSITIGNVHDNRFYIPDFTIAIGETKEVSIILDNEMPFTAFQTDVYLPEGLNYVEDSESMTSRAADGHTLSAKSFPDGRVRLVCFCTSSTPFSGNSGPLVNFKLTASDGIAETSEISLQNSCFSLQKADEYIIPDSSCEVSTGRVMVKSIVLNTTSEQIKCTEAYQLYAEILPHNASNKELTWKSSDEEVASVSATGLVTALKAGETVITASATDGSEVEASCSVIVVSDGNESDALDELYVVGISIAVEDRTVTVTGKHLENILLYSLDGLLITPKSTDGIRIDYLIPSPGVYILQTVRGSHKIKI